jgi:hypothetical protein
MCMLCVIPPNVIPSREKLENSALNNPDGFGFAIIIPAEDRIHVERTMNPDTSINRFLEMRTKYPESFAMWHARLATHGSTTVDNCHPFQVGYDNRTVLAHNGILPIVQPTGDLRSDTRIFAEDLLPSIGGVSALDNVQVMNLVEDFTTGSKVCILTLDPEAKRNCYLIHEEKGNIDGDGVWWSNDSCDIDYSRKWLWANTATSMLSDNTYEQYSMVECPACFGMLDSWQIEEDDLSFCPYCHSCFECEQYKEACLCYKGKEHDKAYHLTGSIHLDRPKSRYDKAGGWHIG